MIILDYQGRYNIITGVLVRGSQDGDRKRRENWSRYHSDVEPGIKEWGQPLETEKGKKIDFPLEPSKYSSATHLRMMTLEN